jgi:ABC-type branched-subunit amino acid transport system ATPase component/ABC-type branched-subunit amino acid transport system permease subunit
MKYKSPIGLKLHRSLYIFFVIFSLTVPFWANQYILHVFTIGFIHILLAVSLNLAMGFAGQLTLAHVAVYGFGAYATANFYIILKFPYIVSIFCGAFFAAFVGIFLGFLASRLKSFYLGISTLSFTMLSHWFFVHGGSITKGASGWFIPRPDFIFISSNNGIFYLSLIIAFIVLWFGANIAAGPFGRRLAALADIENACGNLGIDIKKLKYEVFVISSFIAGLAGGLLIGILGFADPESFHFVSMIVQFLMVILGGLNSIFGGLIGAITLTGLWEWVRAFEGLWEIVLGAILLMLMILAPYGLYGFLIKIFPKWREPRHAISTVNFHINTLEEKNSNYNIDKNLNNSIVIDKNLNDSIVIDNVSKNFGGVKALNKIDLKIKEGEIHAIIGPNGSGKSTFIDVLSGAVPFEHGNIKIFGQKTNNLKSHEIAKMGVSRTFQNFRISSKLNVLENVLLGSNIRQKYESGAVIRSHEFLREEKNLVEEALIALEFVGMSNFINSRGNELSGGQMRLVELARGIMAKPKVMLLDEPAAGLSIKHVDTASRVIKKLRDELSVTVILVEHVLRLVMDLSDRVTVLNSGKLIASSSPEKIKNMTIVKEAYLGKRKNVF